MTRRAPVVAFVAFVTTFATRAFAHDPFELTSVVRVGTDTLTVETTMARATAQRMATGDHRIRTSFSVEGFSLQRSKLEVLAPSLVDVACDGQRLPVRSASTRLTQENDVEIVVTHDRPCCAGLRYRAQSLRELPEGYTQALSAVERDTNRALGFKILTAAEPDVEFPLPGGTTARPTVAVSSTAEFVRFLALGLEHILTGYDHVLFLGGVLLACRALKNLLALVTCFTVAHSVTLALAVLGHVSVPARVVEPLIALSIVLVGLENLFSSRDDKRRLALTFVFGLVHGLGFAGALEGLAMTKRGVTLSLFSFNLGIELGQIALSALLVPLFLKLRGTRMGLRSLRFASVLVCGIGCFWFCERLVTA